MTVAAMRLMMMMMRVSGDGGRVSEEVFLRKRRMVVNGGCT